ncbi:MAG: GNAT family N-acetyltransferase [Fimbriimonadaceae bacterium]
MQLKFHIIETPAQWDQAAALSCAFFPEDPVTGPELQRYASEHPTDIFLQRFLVTEEDAPVAYIRQAQSYWLEDQTISSTGIYVQRAESHVPLWLKCLAHSEEQARENDMKKSQLWVRSDHPELIEAIETQGYIAGQVNPVSAAFLDEFDPAPYQDVIERVQLTHEILDLNQYIERFPDDWMKRYYDFDMIVSRDIPMPGEFKELPFDSYTKMMLNPDVTREGFFVALRGDELEAMTQVHWNRLDPKLATTGLTGTLREARRLGLATALKAKAMTWAKSVGIERLGTDNEENNPMYQLNLALGFKWVNNATEYSKKLC